MHACVGVGERAVFQSVTRARADCAASLMRPRAVAERPVLRASTPRQTCRHCSVALLPLPFSPLMKFRCGLQQRGRGVIDCTNDGDSHVPAGR